MPTLCNTCRQLKQPVRNTNRVLGRGGTAPTGRRTSNHSPVSKRASETYIPFLGDFSSSDSSKIRNCGRKSFVERPARGANKKRVGNTIHKGLTYLANKKLAAAVMGARVPIVMTSRADTTDTKLFSIAIATYIS